MEIIKNNPILKYVGGKRKDFKYFEQFIPLKFDNYYELFCGGASTWYKLFPARAILNDTDSLIIKCYKNIKDNFYQVRIDLQKMFDEFNYNNKHYKEKADDVNKQFYNKLKDDINRGQLKYQFAAYYIFLNKLSFGAYMRYKNGKLSCSYSNSHGIKALQVNKVLPREYKQLFQNTKFYNENYTKILPYATSKDFVFLDPPYVNVDNTAYNFKNDFGKQQQVELSRLFKQSPAKIMIVINETELTDKMYSGYVKQKYNYSYSWSQNKHEHLIITNYDIPQTSLF